MSDALPQALTSAAPPSDHRAMYELRCVRVTVTELQMIYKRRPDQTNPIGPACERLKAAIDACLLSPTWRLELVGALLRSVQIVTYRTNDERAASVALQGLAGLAAEIVQEWRHER